MTSRDVTTGIIILICIAFGGCAKSCFAYEGQPEDYMGTVTFCGNPSGDTAKGWPDHAFCTHGHLVLVIESKVKGKMVYTEKPLEERIYHRSETGLKCGISIYKCEVENFNEKINN